MPALADTDTTYAENNPYFLHLFCTFCPIYLGTCQQTNITLLKIILSNIAITILRN